MSQCSHLGGLMLASEITVLALATCGETILGPPITLGTLPERSPNNRTSNYFQIVPGRDAPALFGFVISTCSKSSSWSSLYRWRNPHSRDRWSNSRFRRPRHQHLPHQSRCRESKPTGRGPVREEHHDHFPAHYWCCRRARLQCRVHQGSRLGPETPWGKA